MQKWKATLSNGEVVDEHDMQTWRNLSVRCYKEGLKIKSLKFEDKEVDPSAVSYFIIFDSLTFLMSKQQRWRRGIGSVRPNGKARIVWRTIQGTIENGDYTEVSREVDKAWKEVAIEVDRSQDENQETCKPMEQASSKGTDNPR